MDQADAARGQSDRQTGLKGRGRGLAFGMTPLKKAKIEGDPDDEGSIESLLQQRAQLRAKVEGEREPLRKLNLLKTYHTTGEMQRLEDLISKWRTASQEAVLALQAASQSDCSVTQLLTLLQIEPSLLRYNIEDECFE
eukprot:comp11910_c0_seq1/m.6561 comp11910_c0_seq1/g.6561  ORF comp11910_c0_seq1/g.6561 comp11910_c0_seq1/m.6561 type:complete len:138 (-) comp11910_c0_seq1:483-896(-)